LKKIRNSKYPLSRLLKLIEAISKDLSAQMLKTLYTQQLMLIGYDDFERVYKSSMLVFHVWDDEYEKLHGLLREISKRKREDAALMWRINSVHKRLQLRLNKIHT
jgi:dynein heavy chain 1